MRRHHYALLAVFVLLLSAAYADTYVVRVYPYIVPTSDQFSLSPEKAISQDDFVIVPGGYAYAYMLTDNNVLVVKFNVRGITTTRYFSAPNAPTTYNYGLRYDLETNSVDVLIVTADGYLTVYRVRLSDFSVLELLSNYSVGGNQLYASDTGVVIIAPQVGNASVLFNIFAFRRITDDGNFVDLYADQYDTGAPLPLISVDYTPLGVEYLSSGRRLVMFGYDILAGDPAQRYTRTVITGDWTSYVDGVKYGAMAGCPETNTVLFAKGQSLQAVWLSRTSSSVAALNYDASFIRPGMGTCIHGVPVLVTNDEIVYGDTYLHQEEPIIVPINRFPNQIVMGIRRSPISEDGYILIVNADNLSQYSLIRLSRLFAHFDPSLVYLSDGDSTTIHLSLDLYDPLATVNVSYETPAWISLSPECYNCDVTVSVSSPTEDYNVAKAIIDYSPENIANTYTFTAGLLVVAGQATGPPSIPTLYDVPDTTATEVNLTWSRSTDPDGDPVYYEVWVRDDTDNNVANAVTTDTYYVLSGLVAGRTYTWTVRACDQNSCSQWAPEDSFRVIEHYSVQLVSPEDGAVYTSATVPYIASYTTNLPDSALYIEYSTDGSAWTTVDTYDVSLSEGTVTGSLSLSDGTYFIQARMTTPYGESYDSAMITINTSTNYTLVVTYPADGSIFYAAPGGSIAIQVSATFNTAPDVGNREYRIEVHGPSGVQTVATVTTDEQTYSLNGTATLGEGNYLIFPVYISPNGDTFYGDPVRIEVQESETANNPPSVPVINDINDTTESTVVLSWHASTDPDGDPVYYVVQLTTDPLFEEILFTTTTDETSVEVNGLYGGNTYFWRVRACDSHDACSDWSDVDYFAVYETTALELLLPPNDASYVADVNGTAPVEIRVSYTSNTDEEYNISIYYYGTSSGSIANFTVQAPVTDEYNTTYYFPEGNYTIVAAILDANTGTAIYSEDANIYVYPAGTPAPTVNLVDPPDGYYEEIPIGQTAPITARAEFNLVKTGAHTLYIEYKLRWGTTWTPIAVQAVTASEGNMYFTLLGDVNLSEGIYYFRARAVDPDGSEWYSDIHSVTIRAVTVGGGGGEGGEGGGGGGGGGGAPLLVGVEYVEVNVPEGGTQEFTIPVKNTSTSPIKVTIEYSDEIVEYIELPPPGTTVVLKVGDTVLKFKATSGDLKAGDSVEGKIYLVTATGSRIEVPVKITVVEGEGGVAYVPGVTTAVIAASILLLLAYLYMQGVIG